MDFTPLQTLLVFIVTLCGETFGAMFGGGSFFTQPALLAAGVPANMAVANDVTAAAFASLTFLYTVRKQQRSVSNSHLARIILLMAPVIMLGAFIGGHLMSSIPEATMRWVIIVICSIGVAYTFFKVKSGPTIRAQSSFVALWPVFALLAALGLGMYDGLSGAGSGILLILMLTLIFRADMKTTLFLANILSVISLGAAGVTFFFVGLLSWQLLAVMVPACLIAGAVAGKISMVLPEQVLRIIYGTVIALLMTYLLYGMV